MKLGHFLRVLRAFDLRHIAACGERRQLADASGNIVVTLCGSSGHHLATRPGAVVRRKLIAALAR